MASRDAVASPRRCGTVGGSGLRIHMSSKPQDLDALVGQKYRHGFVTDIESDTVAAGARRGGDPAHFAEEGRAAVHARLAAQGLPALADDAASRTGRTCVSRRSTIRPSRTTRRRKRAATGRRAWTEVDPKLLATYEKLGVPLHERARLAGVAVDAVFDSVSVATTFKERLAKAGVIFCSFSEAVREHPELVEQYLGTVVPYTDNFFAALNSAVFTDGSFVYVPQGVRCPMELSTYFRINAANTGQFERTLIIADEGSYVSYLEGCTAPDARREPAARGGRRAGRARRRADQVLDRAELVSGRRARPRRHLQLRDQARRMPRRRLADQLDAGRDRVGDHLEIPELRAARRQLGRRVLFRRARPTITSRPTPAPR